jgi:hypothetical protein
VYDSSWPLAINDFKERFPLHKINEIKVQPAISIPSPEEAWRMYLDEEFGLGASNKPLKFLGYQMLYNNSVIVYYFEVKAGNTSSWLKQIHLRFIKGSNKFEYRMSSNYDINDPLWQNIIKTQLTK